MLKNGEKWRVYKNSKIQASEVESQINVPMEMFKMHISIKRLFKNRPLTSPYHLSVKHRLTLVKKFKPSGRVHSNVLTVMQFLASDLFHCLQRYLFPFKEEYLRCAFKIFVSSTFQNSLLFIATSVLYKHICLITVTFVTWTIQILYIGELG